MSLIDALCSILRCSRRFDTSKPDSLHCPSSYSSYSFLTCIFLVFIRIILPYHILLLCSRYNLKFKCTHFHVFNSIILHSLTYPMQIFSTYLIIKNSSHLRISSRRLPLPFSTIFSMPIISQHSNILVKSRFEAHNNASSSKIPPLSLAFIPLSRSST